MGNIIQSFWYDVDTEKSGMSEVEILCALSYLAHGHDFHLYTYNTNGASMRRLQSEITKKKKHDRPYGNLIIINANEIVDSSAIFFDDRGKVGIAAFSDFFRFHLLKAHGNFWVDMDTVCMKPFDFTDEYVFASQLDPRGLESIATTCIIGAPKDSSFINELLRQADKILNDPNNILENANGIKKVRWGIIGPGFLNANIKKLNMNSYVKSPEYFCEINWYDAKDFIKPNAFSYMTLGKNIYAMHLWNAMWRDIDNISKEEKYDKDSVFETLKAMYFGDYENNLSIGNLSWFLQEYKKDGFWKAFYKMRFGRYIMKRFGMRHPSVEKF